MLARRSFASPPGVDKRSFLVYACTMRRPYFRKDRNAWYGVINGRRTKLAEDKATAFAKWKQLLTPSNEMLVSTMVQKFLDRPRKASTQRFYEHHLRLFLNETGSSGRIERLRVCDLRAHHLTTLLDKHVGNYAHNIGRSVKTAFKWLVDEEHIARSPFAKVKTPPAISRGDEAYIPPEQWAKLVEKITDDDVRDILTVLRETGCRPQEARRLEARHLQGSLVVLRKKESKGGRTQRVIHLSDDAATLLRRLALRHPTGPLLRNGSEPWTSQCLANRCYRLGFTPYQVRHTWATDAILRGIDLQTISVLMGHSSLAMLTRVYAHVQKCREHMGDAVRRATA